MTSALYQEKAHEFADYPVPVNEGKTATALMRYTYPVMGLCEEAGEVAGKFAKALRDDEGFITPERKEQITKELGDVLWMVAEIATLLNVPLGDIMEQNIEKLESRRSRGVIHGSGDNR